MPHKGSLYSGIALLSAATLMFELLLTRLFAVAEWYHFAFLSVSVALLGNAFSGTLLALLPSAARKTLPSILAPALPLSILGAYWALNTIPFDSYQLAWDGRQWIYLLLYYLSLAVPFAVSGLMLACWLVRLPAQSNALYGANLAGSALGSLALLASMPLLGGEGSVLATVALGAVGGTLILRGEGDGGAARRMPTWAALGLAVGAVALLSPHPPWMALRLSPYKSLSAALRAADARLGYRRWNVYARVDVVESDQLHSAPGLSLKYTGRLPPQYGLTVDGGDLSPLSRRTAEGDTTFLAYLPSAIPHRLRPGASTLLLQPRGGLDVAVALHAGASHVTVAEDNPLIVQAVREVYGDWVGQLYNDPRVSIVTESGRSVLRRGDAHYDIVQFSLAEGYHPVASGSYSLAENHLYTVQAAGRALERLREGGLLVITRWLQDVPSESVRAGALAVTALEESGRDPAQHLLVFRSWSTMTILASRSPFSVADVALLRRACEELGYDLVYYPGMPREEANRYNRLPDPLYYDAFRALLSPRERATFYAAQYYDITPPTDDRPFFGHYFRWRQIPQIIAQWGKTWQPFGGSGFLLVLGLLGLAIAAAVILVLLPLVWLPRGAQRSPYRARTLLYFAALGLGFLMVEMPLMQHYILYLGQPALAFIVVLSALLLAAGCGSLLAPRANLRLALIALVAAIALYPIALERLFEATLGLGAAPRAIIAAASLSPLGLLMGVPFAGGMRRIEALAPGHIPWIWAINGSASVISSILATVVALSGGYRLVLALAAGCYLAASVAFWPLMDR